MKDGVFQRVAFGHISEVAGRLLSAIGLVLVAKLTGSEAQSLWQYQSADLDNVSKLISVLVWGSTAFIYILGFAVFLASVFSFRQLLIHFVGEQVQTRAKVVFLEVVYLLLVSSLMWSVYVAAFPLFSGANQ